MSVLRRRIDQILESIWPGAVAGQVPVFDGTHWVPTTPTGGFSDPSIFWVSSAAAAGGDGSQAKPFNTIQAFCDAVPALPVSTPVVALIAPGQYDEDVVLIGTDHFVTLCGLGVWTLGGGASVGNFTWHTDTGATFFSILTICSVNNNVPSVQGFFYPSLPYINGDFLITTTATPGFTILNLSCTIAGNLDGTGMDPASMLFGQFSNLSVFDQVNVPTMYAWIMNSCYIGNDYSSSTIQLAQNCFFNGPISLINGMSTSPDTTSGFVDCFINGDITVPSGYVYFDSPSYGYMYSNSRVVVGGQSYVVDWVSQGLYKNSGSVGVLDDDYVPLNNLVDMTSMSGWGTVHVGDDAEFARFTFDSAANVTLRENTVNVANADLDGNLCIFSNGAGLLQIRNRLGSPLTVRWDIYYSMP